MNYEGKYYGHELWTPRVCHFRSIQELGTHEIKAIHSIFIIISHSTPKKLDAAHINSTRSWLFKLYSYEIRTQLKLWVGTFLSYKSASFRWNAKACLGVYKLLIGRNNPKKTIDDRTKKNLLINCTAIWLSQTIPMIYINFSKNEDIRPFDSWCVFYICFYNNVFD